MQSIEGLDPAEGPHARFYRNTLNDEEEGQPSDGQLRGAFWHAALAGIEVLERDKDTEVVGGSVYNGRAGIALVYLRLATALRKRGASAGGIPISPELALKRGIAHAEWSLHRTLPPPGHAHGRVSFLEGRPGALAVMAALCHHSGDSRAAVTASEELIGYAAAVAHMDPGECEVLYGRAGYLYALLFAWHHGGGHTWPRELRASYGGAMDQMAAQILQDGKHLAQSPRAPEGMGALWSWHGKPYLGGAHGSCGILHTLLLRPSATAPQPPPTPPILASPPMSPSGRRSFSLPARSLSMSGEPISPKSPTSPRSPTSPFSRTSMSSQQESLPASPRPPPPLAPALEPELQDMWGAAVPALLHLQLPSGNLPSSLGNESDKLVHWCHGSPALVMLLDQAGRALGARPDWTAAAGRAAQDVWYRGLLTKGVGLCHGISGNAYALLSHSNATGEALWRRRAVQFGLFAAHHWQHLYGVPDAAASLYEGLGGAVCLWLDLLHPEEGAMPGFQL